LEITVTELNNRAAMEMGRAKQNPGRRAELTNCAVRVKKEKKGTELNTS
jgi:hypothetical protein